MAARYRLQEHPDFTGALSREDLYVLAERGSIGRGDICEEEESGVSHTVGELISGLRRVRFTDGQSRLGRPSYLEIRPDGVRETAVGAPSDGDEDDEDDDDDEELEFGVDALNGEEAWTASGERILYHGHPSWLLYGKGLFLTALLAVAGGVAVMFGPHYAAIGFLCASTSLICIAIARHSKDYLITEERVEVMWGLIGRSSKEVRIRDIRSIDVRENWISGLLGLGSVDFSSAGNAGIEVAFEWVRRAHRIKELVRRLQSQSGV